MGDVLHLRGLSSALAESRATRLLFDGSLCEVSNRINIVNTSPTKGTIKCVGFDAHAESIAGTLEVQASIANSLL